MLNSGKVTAFTNTRIRDLILREGRLSGALLEKDSGEKSIEAEGLFRLSGAAANNALFTGQVELTPEGYISAGMDMSTNLPGVFGAGDINHKPFRQITTAMADGTVAALAAEHYIRSLA